MPKKTTSARGGASRNKPKSQKSIQLVRPTPAENDRNDTQEESSAEETALAKTAGTSATSTATVSKAEVATTRKSEADKLPARKEETVAEAPTSNKNSAAARLAARRQAALKQQTQRSASLITAEHYIYVKRDLIYIAILAAIMFAVIITLHFVPGIGS